MAATAMSAWETAEAAVIAAMDKEILDLTTTHYRWNRYLHMHFPGLREQHHRESMWSWLLYEKRRFNMQGFIPSIMFPSAWATNGPDTEMAHRVPYFLQRLTRDELWDVAEWIKTYNAGGRSALHRQYTQVVLMEQRRRATPAELICLREADCIAQSNVIEFLFFTLPGNAARLIQEFAPCTQRSRPLALSQRFTLRIDALRKENLYPLAFAHRFCLLFPLSGGFSDPSDPALRSILLHLTNNERFHVLSALKCIFNAEETSFAYDPCGISFQTLVVMTDALNEIRTDRVNLDASCLIQRLARRDADAAQYLASMITCTVDLTKPRTYIRVQPVKWYGAGVHSGQLKRRIEDAVASRARSKATHAPQQQN